MLVRTMKQNDTLECRGPRSSMSLEFRGPGRTSLYIVVRITVGGHARVTAPLGPDASLFVEMSDEEIVEIVNCGTVNGRHRVGINAAPAIRIIHPAKEAA